MVTLMFLKIIIILKCVYKISSLGYSVIAVQTTNTGRYMCQTGPSNVFLKLENDLPLSTDQPMLGAHLEFQRAMKTRNDFCKHSTPKICLRSMYFTRYYCISANRNYVSRWEFLIRNMKQCRSGELRIHTKLLGKHFPSWNGFLALLGLRGRWGRNGCQPQICFWTPPSCWRQRRLTPMASLL